MVGDDTRVSPVGVQDSSQATAESSPESDFTVNDAAGLLLMNKTRLDERMLKRKRFNLIFRLLKTAFFPVSNLCEKIAGCKISGCYVDGTIIIICPHGASIDANWMKMLRAILDSQLQDEPPCNCIFVCYRCQMVGVGLIRSSMFGKPVAGRIWSRYHAVIVQF